MPFGVLVWKLLYRKLKRENYLVVKFEKASILTWSWSVVDMERIEPTKKKSEPEFVLDWLKETLSGVEQSGGTWFSPSPEIFSMRCVFMFLPFDCLVFFFFDFLFYVAFGCTVIRSSLILIYSAKPWLPGLTWDTI